MNEKAYQRLGEIHDELHTMANTFAGSVTGPIAVELHQIANRIYKTRRMMTSGVTIEDTDRQAEEWCDNQMMPMGRQRTRLEAVLTKEKEAKKVTKASVKK
jgi:hypothetical protein